MIGLIVLAVVAAGGTYLLFKNFIITQQSEQERIIAERTASKTRILVADRPLPRGATITSGSLTWRPWPKDHNDPNYIVQTEQAAELENQFIGSVVITGIGEGEPITAKKVFKRGSAGFLAGTLAPGMRAVTITTTAVSASGGFIQPGDRVDILMTLDISRDAADLKDDTGLIDGRMLRYVAETFLHDIKVVAVDQDIGGGDGSSKVKVGKTVTVEVTPHQVEVIEVAKRMGKLSLTLRSTSVPGSQIEPGTFTSDLQISPTLLTLFRDVIDRTPPPVPVMTPTLAPVAPVVAPEAPKKAARPSKSRRITVYRGGTSSTKDYSDR